MEEIIQTHAEALHAQAVMQTVTVKGQVMDPTGVPVIGASVLEKGTSNGVITDIDGKFFIESVFTQCGSGDLLYRL